MNSFFAAMQRFGVGRLAVLLGVGGGAAALIVTIVMNLASGPMSLLYANLDLKEAGTITQALDQAGIKYEAKGDGSSIMVPRDKVATARLMLAEKGLPTSDSVGYEIFDTQNALGQTDFVQQLNMKRATEGELARTIRSWDGVTFARVHVVLPERQLFQDTTDQASASVTIGEGARQPSPDTVRAVQALVAGAVPDLKPDKVVVIDQHGKTLSADSDDDGAAAADQQRSAIEAQIQDRVKNLVEGVVGVGRARVEVSADIDMSQVNTTEQKYDPDGQVVRSQETTQNTSKETDGGGANGATAATASANVPGGTQTSSNSSTSGNESQQGGTTTNYEISQTTTQTEQPAGTIKRLSVAVAVDGITGPPGKDGKPGPWSPRSAEEMQHLNDLVKAAIGFSSDRGDQVQVVNVHFPSDDDAEGVTAANPMMGFDKNDIMRAVELAILGAVAIMIVLMVLRPMVRAAAQGASAAGMTLIPMAGGGGQAVRMVAMPDGQMVADSGGGATQPLALPGPDIDQKIDIARIEGQVKASSVKRVSEFVDKHPEESVSILRSWLHESA